MNRVKSALLEKKITLGSWITLGHVAVAEILCRAGYEWLVVDLEHSVITIKETEELIRVISLHGVTPLVRLTSNDSDLIKRVMDAGAGGIIVPMVNSQADAVSAVNSVYYPPKGKRGVGLARAQGYGTSFEKYKQWLKEDAIVIVQMEHIEAVRNAKEILNVDGVDGFIVGPYDLSASMGIPGQFEDANFKSALNEIKDLGRKYNKSLGYHLVEPDLVALDTLIQDGYTFIGYSLDIRMLDVAARKAQAHLKDVR